MSGWNRNHLVGLIVGLVLVVAVVALAVKRVQDVSGERAALTAVERPPTPVRAVRVQTGPVQSLVFGQGTARAVRRDFLTFEGSGKVTFVKSNPDGRPIRAGDRVRGPRPGERLGELLASLDSRAQVEQVTVAQAGISESRQQVQAAQARLEQAEAQRRLAAETLSRNQALFEQQALSQHELDVVRTNLEAASSAVNSARADLDAARSGVSAAQARMEQSRLPVERNSIYAPFDGILAQVNINEGDFFAPNIVDVGSEEAAMRTIPLLVIDPRAMEVTMELPAFEGMQVRPGQPAMIMLDPTQVPDPESVYAAILGLTEGESESGDGDREEALRSPSRLTSGAIPGLVFSVSPSISPGGRSIQVKVRTDQADGLIRDGMFVACWIVVQEKAEALLAPFDVFVYRQNRPFVFEVDEQAQTVIQRPVEEGIAGLEVQEIVSGVEPGALLVTDGRHGLTSGTPVEVVEVVVDHVNRHGEDRP